MNMKAFRLWLVYSAVLLLTFSTAKSQDNQGSSKSQSSQASQGSDEPDQPVASQSEKLKLDQAQALSTAWEMLQATNQASKSREHISLLVALGTLGGYKQAEDMLTTAMKDTDIDIRLAAVAAAG